MHSSQMLLSHCSVWVNMKVCVVRFAVVNVHSISQSSPVFVRVVVFFKGFLSPVIDHLCRFKNGNSFGSCIALQQAKGSIQLEVAEWKLPLCGGCLVFASLDWWGKKYRIVHDHYPWGNPRQDGSRGGFVFLL